MPTALIGLGSNLGNRRQWLDEAVQQLTASEGISSVRASRWHTTKAVGGPPGQPDFLNGAAVLETSLSPAALLARLQTIENELDRVRHQPWGPRTVDLDLLLFDQLVQRNAQLELPHRRMAFRRFVLEPASEIAGQMIHPTTGWSVQQLLDHLNTALPYVAISGSLFRATQELARAAAAKTGWRLLEFPDAGDETPPAGSPSLSLAQTIEFLREQAELLARKNWMPESAGAISSFWIEDLLAICDVLWPGELDDQWQQLADKVLRPKILVVYDATSQQFVQQESDSQQKPAIGIAVALWHRLNEARRARAARLGVGPVLWLETSEPEMAEREVVAAIQAMS
jgi:2-amino-4-hydroxy-6-hydroxymethyldihydropteridine diphosphokinase